MGKLERIFRNKYFSKRYYDGKDKELYEIKMGSMTDEQYTTRFIELLRYVPYLKDDKSKIQRFINGFPLSFEDRCNASSHIYPNSQSRQGKHEMSFTMT